NGPTFINILAPCPRGWRTAENQGMEITKLAVETNYWPLYEIEDGDNYNLNYKPKEQREITDWLKPQGRFKHLFKEENKEIVDEIQAHVNKRWQRLLELCGEEEE
ncbi:MAG: pyruvate ferredoxin oxidoreductase, partial [bacterium]